MGDSKMEEYLKSIYKKVASTCGKVHIYLGMILNSRMKTKVQISMIKYIKDMIK